MTKYCTLDNIDVPQNSMLGLGVHDKEKSSLGLDYPHKCEFIKYLKQSTGKITNTKGYRCNWIGGGLVIKLFKT